MATQTVTMDSFRETIADNDIVLLDFWAEWCGPCRSFAPVFEKASDEHSDVVFGKIDTEDQRELAGGFGITSIPTLAAFREGIMVFSQPGALPAPALEQVITAVKGLDMDDVRRQIAEQQAAGDAGVFGGHTDFGDRRRYWDFRSVGRGNVDFEEIIRALNRIAYQGPLSVEWEDSGMDREHGAAEACAYLKEVDFEPSAVTFDAAFAD